MFNEPHSTKPVEDCVGWGLESTPEMLVTAGFAAGLEPEEARELAARVRCPVLVIHGNADAITAVGRGVALAAQTASVSTPQASMAGALRPTRSETSPRPIRPAIPPTWGTTSR